MSTGRRTSFRKAAAARFSGRARVTRAPSPPARPEGIRWLRSDGSPNWSQRIAERIGELAIVASRPPVTVSTSSNILEAVEVMTEKRVRGLPVVDAKERLAGLVTAMDLVNYLGGGEYYSIVVNRHGDNIFRALRDEKITSIMNPAPAYLTRANSLTDALYSILQGKSGMIPVLYEDGTIYGIVTEHDIVARLKGVKVGVKVKEVMSRNIVVVGLDDSIKKAAELMVKHGFRRLPAVTERGEAKGMVSAKDYVAFFGSHRAFKLAATGRLSEVIEKTPVYEIAEPGLFLINEAEDLGEAAKVMIENNLNGLLVVDDSDNVVGIITERDVIIGIALSPTMG